jgi:hypothetical protein
MVMDQRPTDVGRLLSDGRADPDARDAEGDPVLNLAAAHGQLDSPAAADRCQGGP